MIYQVTAEPRIDQPAGRAVVREVEAECPEEATILAGLYEAQLQADRSKTHDT